ncbi:MAG: hypothetical protein IPP94_10480 [Ignavibacteria bacterium]|nr:hypothetical protein [Ignavibacteria bacterium]
MKRSTLFSLALFLLAFAGASGQPFDLRYAMKDGAVLKYKKLESTKSVAQTVRGNFADMEKSTEAFCLLTAEKPEGGDLVYIFLQDTVYVEDHSQSAAGGAKSFDFLNAISKKPIRVRMSSKGDLRGAVPLAPIDISASPVPVSERTLTRQAAILPVLPLRGLKVGDTWTDAVKDTTRPKQRDPRFGEGNGARYTAIRTSYSVDSLVTLRAHRCLKITWKSTVSIETKMIFAGSESFTEEASSNSGSMYFDPARGVLVELSIRTEKESTTAVFSRESEVIPTTSTVEMRLQLLPS